MPASITIETVSWAEAAPLLLEVRRTVFVVEQGVPEDREIDEQDPTSRHFLARDAEGRPVGTARLLSSGRIGRVAVLAELRRTGVGRALMLAAVAEARQRGESVLRLHAQVHSIPFYESLGFTLCGEEFIEEGIPHREMILAIPGESGRGPRKNPTA